MWKFRVAAIGILVLSGALAYVLLTNQVSDIKPFVRGLDLAGGAELTYRADTSALAGGETTAAMNALREVIERRVNAFGVSEPVVRTATVFGEERLIVELPGVTDLTEAADRIGKTPLLEFKLQDPIPSFTVSADGVLTQVPGYIDTGLTGRYVARARLEFAQSATGGVTNEPMVAVEFSEEGAALFEKITRENVGKPLVIFLDGQELSSPTIQEAISGGTASISGSFTPDQAKELVDSLNLGALPVPIELIASNSVGAGLGDDALQASILAGIIGLAVVSVFMVLWYRLPGLIAVIALKVYVVLVLAAFQYIPVTLSAAGLAAFVLSIGIAVDANVLIFERIKDERRKGTALREAIKQGFARAWPAIRDSNISSLITAIILFWFGTSFIKGFALVFALGVLVSMLTAIAVSRTLLLALPLKEGKIGSWLLGSGMSNRV